MPRTSSRIAVMAALDSPGDSGEVVGTMTTIGDKAFLGGCPMPGSLLEK
jgi:hypothetical protein